jgi:hypothetical protein
MKNDKIKRGLLPFLRSEHYELRNQTSHLPADLAAKRLDSDAFRADIYRRSRAPFVFKPWQRRAQTTDAQKMQRRFKAALAAVIGGTVLAIGIAVALFPGAAFVTIPAGLAILAIEYIWFRSSPKN